MKEPAESCRAKVISTLENRRDYINQLIEKTKNLPDDMIAELKVHISYSTFRHSEKPDGYMRQITNETFEE